MARDPPSAVIRIDFKLNTLNTKSIMHKVETYNDWFSKMAQDIANKVKLDDFDPSAIDFTTYGRSEGDISKLDESIGLVKGQPDVITDTESGNDTANNDEVFVEAPDSVASSNQPSGSIASTATYETAKSKIPESATRSTRKIARLKQTAPVNQSVDVVDQTIRSQPIVIGSAAKKTPLGSSRRYVSRTGGKNAPGSDSKNQTDSAVKRKREAERLRIEALERQMKEKEEKALRHKQQIMEMKQTEMKMKREEKERKVAEQREQLERDAMEKRLRESARKREIEKRRREIEEAKKEGLRKKQELLKKQEEEEQSRKVNEEKDRQERIKKEEEERKRADEAERLRQEQVAKDIKMKIEAMKQQKNNSLLQKANVNSFIQKTAAVAGASLISEDESQCQAGDMTDATNATNNESVAATTSKQDSTFVVPKPKPVPQSYDISDLKSDNESDDERNPRHKVPEWAGGQRFLESLTKQFGRPAAKRSKDVAYIFRDVILPVELGTVFSNYAKSVISKYEKRTSSAHWNTPPASKLNLSSFLDQSSMNRSRVFETSIAEHPE